MAEETWKVILEESSSSTSEGATPASTAMGQSLSSKSPEERTIWQDAGKVLGAVAGVSTLLAVVISSIHRSKIFSTFMDSLLTIFSALMDLLLVPLVPILGPALVWIWRTLGPLVVDFSKQVSKFIEDPWEGIKNIFSGAGDAIRSMTALFGGGPDSALGVIGDNAAKILTVAGDKISKAGQDMWQILTNDSLTWQEKISQVWETLKTLWTDFINDPTVQEAWKTIWNTIQEWVNAKFTEVFNTIKEFVLTNMPIWIKEALNKIPEILRTVLSDARDSFTNKVDKVVETEGGWLPAIGKGISTGWDFLTGNQKQKVDVEVKVNQEGKVTGVEIKEDDLIAAYQAVSFYG